MLEYTSNMIYHVIHLEQKMQVMEHFQQNILFVVSKHV